MLRWGTSSAGWPSHCFYSPCRGGNIEEDALKKTVEINPAEKSGFALGAHGERMVKDLLLERCLVKVMSRSLQEKIQVLRWGTSSAGGPSHCFC